MIKKLIFFFCFLLTLNMFGTTLADFNEFLPAGKMIQEGKVKEGISELKKIAPRNEFAMVALYLIYSRGYCNVKADPQMAITKYFDPLLGTFFHSREWQIYTQKRFPPVNGRTELILRDEYGHYHAKLQGKYPIAECYEEKMLQIGGVIPRTIFEVASVGLKEWKLPMETACKMGNAAAYAWQQDVNVAKNSPEFAEHIKGLEKAAELIHIPSMIRLAEIRMYPIPKSDYRRAAILLQTAKKELKRYSSINCHHAALDLQKCEKLLKSLPDYSKTSEQLIEDRSKTLPDSVLFLAITEELARRNDHIEGTFIRIQSQLKNPQKQKELMPEVLKLAEKGCRGAILFLLRNDSRPMRVQGFYFAGKAGLRYQEFQTPQSCYKQALKLLQEFRFFPDLLPPREYKNQLQRLGEVLPEAKECYDQEFPPKSEIVRTKTAFPDALKTKWEETPHGKVLKINVSPCKQQNYFELFLKPAIAGPRDVMLNLHSFNGVSNLEVWGIAGFADGSTAKIYINNSYFGKEPVRLRINIAPTNRSFELTLNGSIF